MNYRVAVLGPGSWGTALAQVLAENGHDVRIWGHHASQVEEINTQHTNQRYLPDHYLPDSIQAFTNMEDAVKRRRCGAIRHSNESNTFCCKRTSA